MRRLLAENSSLRTAAAAAAAAAPGCPSTGAGRRRPPGPPRTRTRPPCGRLTSPSALPRTRSPRRRRRPTRSWPRARAQASTIDATPRPSTPRRSPSSSGSGLDRGPARRSARLRARPPDPGPGLPGEPARRAGRDRSRGAAAERGPPSSTATSSPPARAPPGRPAGPRRQAPQAGLAIPPLQRAGCYRRAGATCAGRTTGAEFAPPAAGRTVQHRAAAGVPAGLAELFTPPGRPAPRRRHAAVAAGDAAAGASIRQVRWAPTSM